MCVWRICCVIADVMQPDGRPIVSWHIKPRQNIVNKLWGDKQSTSAAGDCDLIGRRWVGFGVRRGGVAPRRAAINAGATPRDMRVTSRRLGRVTSGIKRVTN